MPAARPQARAWPKRSWGRPTPAGSAKCASVAPVLDGKVRVREGCHAYRNNRRQRIAVNGMCVGLLDSRAGNRNGWSTFRPLAKPCTIPEKSVQFAIARPWKSNEFFDGRVSGPYDALCSQCGTPRVFDGRGDTEYKPRPSQSLRACHTSAKHNYKVRRTAGCPGRGVGRGAGINDSVRSRIGRRWPTFDAVRATVPNLRTVHPPRRSHPKSIGPGGFGRAQ